MVTTSNIQLPPCILLRRHHVVICVYEIRNPNFHGLHKPISSGVFVVHSLCDIPICSYLCLPDSPGTDSQLMLSLSKEAFLETCIHRQTPRPFVWRSDHCDTAPKDEASGGTWWTGTISTNLAIFTFHNNILHMDAWWTVKLFSTNTFSSLF